MKLSADSSRKLGEALQKRVVETGMGYSEIGRKGEVHMSQVSRVCRGQFRTLSHNVLQICKVLNVDPEAIVGRRAAFRPGDIDAANPQTDLGRRLVHELVRLWDKTPEDAERIIRLIRDLRDFRGT